jgi:FixJ family two-component response regulator
VSTGALLYPEFRARPPLATDWSIHPPSDRSNLPAAAVPAVAGTLPPRAPLRYAPDMHKGADDGAVVHVIDDDASLRASLDSLFRSVGLTCRTYESAQAFLDAKLPDAPGCIVVDVRLPGMSGLDFQDHLAQLGIHLPVVLMTGHGDIPMSVRAMKAGAVDFLSKPFRDQDMLDAVGAAIERHRQRRAADCDISQVRNRYQTLSPREREVMMLVTSGKMNKQVAGDLGISEITVKIHRGAAMRKMGARTLVELVRMAELVKPRG